MRWAVIAVVCTGCSKLLGIGAFEFSDGGASLDGAHVTSDGSDGASDAAPDAALCFGSLTQLCLTAPPSGNVVISNAIDTSSDPRCTTMTQPAGPELCVIFGSVVEVTGTIATTGARPLVLVAGARLTISGTLDASTTRAGALGGGADPGDCPALTPPAAGSGGGGAGGSFGASGGAGGNGYTGGGSTPAGAQTVSHVRGGCAGADGTSNDAVGTAGTGAGGKGGGALYLIAGDTITISGAVFASGAGGTPGGGYNGGGGGGAGGLIALEARTIAADGALIAANGGGGAGGDSLSGAAGPGADGTTTLPTATAGGGSAGAVYGAGGGNGGCVGQPNGAGGGTGAFSGGGGGGSVGAVWIRGTISGTPQISPKPQ